jgi:RNA polymerase sigma-70 factor (ECF subfamily)
VSRTIDTTAEERELSSEDLIARIAAGDHSAFALFYDLHAARILGWLIRNLKHRADAEDVLQETFHRVWRAAGHYSSRRSSPEVWLMLIARSRLLDFLRRKRPEALGSLVQTVAPQVDLLADLQHGEAAERIHAAMQQLPDAQRSAIALAFFSGLTHQQVAERQCIPLGTAKTRILLGIKSLRKTLSTEESAIL